MSRAKKKGRPAPLKRLVARALSLGARKAGFAKFRPGAEIRHLAGDADRGPCAALLRYAPGASVPAHRHPGFEVIYVLDGAQSDERGTYAAGTLVINPPGGGHHVWSDEGCLVLIIWEHAVEFL